MSTIVALVSAEPDADLVRYLETVGFTVTPFRTPRDAPREGTLVWLLAPTGDDLTVVETVHAWLGSKQRLRAIVVSDRPSRLRAVIERSPGRVTLLPAPVFGWQLVDALRVDV